VRLHALESLGVAGPFRFPSVRLSARTSVLVNASGPQRLGGRYSRGPTQKRDLARHATVQETAVHDLLMSHCNAYQRTSDGISLTVSASCVRTVSHAPRNPGQTPSFTGTRRRISMLREVVDRECVGAFQCASARASGINFQACAFNHLSTLESTACQRATRLDSRKGMRRLRQSCVFCPCVVDDR
jgi:hypothetical protein